MRGSEGAREHVDFRLRVRNECQALRDNARTERLLLLQAKEQAIPRFCLLLRNMISIRAKYNAGYVSSNCTGTMIVLIFRTRPVQSPPPAGRGKPPGQKSRVAPPGPPPNRLGAARPPWSPGSSKRLWRPLRTKPARIPADISQRRQRNTTSTALVRPTGCELLAGIRNQS